ncbi:MAG: hypothetical protein ACPGVG_14595 [Mycobacterium sp.]
MAFTEHNPGTRFPGRAPHTVGESKEARPMLNRARAGAPNVVVFGDIGRGQFGGYGSPINTANVD